VAGLRFSRFVGMFRGFFDLRTVLPLITAPLNGGIDAARVLAELHP
jgi:hypothetical protein